MNFSAGNTHTAEDSKPLSIQMSTRDGVVTSQGGITFEIQKNQKADLLGSPPLI